MIYRVKVKITGREVALGKAYQYRAGQRYTGVSDYWYVGVSDYLYDWLRWARCFDGWQDVARHTQVKP